MKWKNYPQNIKVRLITSFFNRAVSSEVMPFMALFFAQEMNKVWAGIFLTSTVIVSLFISLIVGYTSDRLLRKRVPVLTSLLSAGIFLLKTISLFPEKMFFGYLQLPMLHISLLVVLVDLRCMQLSWTQLLRKIEKKCI